MAAFILLNFLFLTSNNIPQPRKSSVVTRFLVVALRNVEKRSSAQVSEGGAGILGGQFYGKTEGGLPSHGKSTGPQSCSGQTAGFLEKESNVFR